LPPAAKTLFEKRVLDSPIPASKYRVPPGYPDSRAKGIHARQDAQTPPGPSITRNNAMVDVAFPTQARIIKI